jgi:hypothetical protein
MPVAGMGMLYGLVQLVDTGSVTQGKPLDAARIALVRDRLGALLAEQPGAFETYDTEVQEGVTPATWWDDERKVIANPTVAGWLARFWPDQPLSRTLGAYCRVADEAWNITQRPTQRRRWEGVSPESKAYLKTQAKLTKRSEESLRRLSKKFDDRKHREAVQLVRTAAAKLRAAAKLLSESAEEKLEADRELWAAHVIKERAARGPSKEAFLLGERVRKFWASLVDKTFDGLSVPQSAGQWNAWETTVALRLIKLGVPKAKVVALFKSPTADPEDERTRIRKNLRRRSKKTSATKLSTPVKGASEKPRKTGQRVK